MREELELAKARGEVMAVADMERIVSDLVIETTARVMATAPRVAPKVVGESSRNLVQALIEKGLRESLQGMADFTRKLIPAAAAAVAPPPAPPPLPAKRAPAKRTPAKRARTKPARTKKPKAS